MKTFLLSLLLVTLLTFNLTAQPSQFTVDAVTQALINSLHQQAALYNSSAISVYTQAYANWQQNQPVNAAIGNSQPAPALPMLESVNDAQVVALEKDFSHPEKYQLFTYTQYVPPAPPAPTPASTPTDIVGADQGNGFYGCVTGDGSADGTKFMNSRGLFLKHLYLTPFGKSCSWTLIQAAIQGVIGISGITGPANAVNVWNGQSTFTAK